MKFGKNDKYIIMMFEVWSPEEYIKTVYQIVDKGGNFVDGEHIVELCYPLRLMKADNPIRISNNTVLLV